MKLYVTFTSPYARLARIVVLEKGLQDRVEVIGAQTRVADSPYYKIKSFDDQLWGFLARYDHGNSFAEIR